MNKLIISKLYYVSDENIWVKEIALFFSRSMKIDLVCQECSIFDT